MSSYTDGLRAKIERMYDPEMDMHPGPVQVSWTDWALLQIAMDLLERVETLEIVVQDGFRHTIERVETLEDQVEQLQIMVDMPEDGNAPVDRGEDPWG